MWQGLLILTAFRYIPSRELLNRDILLPFLAMAQQLGVGKDGDDTNSQSGA